jgi:NAD(P)-dependent dehydrogenase (short-subunit alcohol dehydrogenase family)
VVINNAGILREESLTKMTLEAFEAVLAVHLRGAFLVTQAAFPHLRDQGYGRIVNTTSPAGLYGNFGQAKDSPATVPPRPSEPATSATCPWFRLVRFTSPARHRCPSPPSSR